MRPNSGTKNQKNGSCEPSKRSFLVKSMADSVALRPQPSQPVEAGLEGAALDIVNPMARKVSARSNSGNDDFRQRSKDSVNVIKMPALDQLQAFSFRRTLHSPLSSYTLNCFRSTSATMTSGKAAKTIL